MQHPPNPLHFLCPDDQARARADRIPPGWRQSLAAYMALGHKPMPVLTAILEDSLADALPHLPDDLTIAPVSATVGWLRTYAPIGSHGCAIRRSAWQRHCGLAGLRAAQRANEHPLATGAALYDQISAASVDAATGLAR